MLRKMTRPEATSKAVDSEEFATDAVHERLQPTWPDSPGAKETVITGSLSAGQTLTVKTRNSSYRLVILDSLEQKILVSGGRLFPQPTKARLLGAVVDRKVQIGRVVVGQGLGLELGGRCIVTSPVVAIEYRASEDASPNG